MTAKVILNPYAGRWKGRALRPQAEAALQRAEEEWLEASAELDEAAN